MNIRSVSRIISISALLLFLLVSCGTKKNQIVLEKDNIRIVFSEKILGVPPLHYWSSWIPQKKDIISLPSDFDVYLKPPVSKNLT
jgi:hypothetical protein